MSTPATTPKPDYILGLDLGKSQDYTALAILERRREPCQDEPEKMEFHYLLSFLKRWPLKTSYPEIVAEVGQLVQTSPLSYPMLAVDETGVGVAIVDMFCHGAVQARVSPIVITGGHQTTFDRGWHVPKKELVSTIQLLLQTQRIKFARMPERELLVQELRTFKVRVTNNANEIFEARDRDHDDMVLAVAMAAWLGEGGQANFDCPEPLDLPPPPTLLERYNRGPSECVRRLHRRIFGR